MRQSGLILSRSFVVLCSIGLLAGVPLSCAQGSSIYDIPNGGAPGVGGLGGAGGAQATGRGGQTATGDEGSSSTTTGGVPSTTISAASSTATTTGGTSTSTSTSTSSSSGGPSSACDLGDCDSCVCCAENDQCSNQVVQCEFLDDDCAAILCCAAGCAANDTACVQQCIDFYPGGESDFIDLNNCLGCACQQTCGVSASSCP